MAPTFERASEAVARTQDPVRQAVISILIGVWEAAGYLWSVRLKALLPSSMPWAIQQAAGEFAHTLNLTDIHTGWTESRALLGKSQIAVQAAASWLHRVPRLSETFPGELKVARHKMRLDRLRALG